MLSFWLSLGSLFLGFLCTSSSPTSKGDEALILDPLFEDGSSVQPQWIHEPRNLEQLKDEQESNYAQCGQTHRLDRGESVAIKSKSRNGKYRKKEDCRWTFEAIDSNSTLTISCGLFQLRACKQSYLRITGGDYSERFCRRRSKLTKTIDDNNMKVYFRTSSSQMRRKGFSCTVTASEYCSTVNRVSRIVGGVETEVNEYPWQAVFVRNGTNDVICGGVLLTDMLIFTTVTCSIK
ncbi:uncharacterized protein [Palaemon carinicauda]|uniref:uncharacterized protein n=1 Tax=Palaemon carinicauda TaxID=392227 RepID=UPI0035B5D9BB